MSVAEDDWRLPLLGAPLVGLTWTHRAYRAPSATWDHDHCELCTTKLMEGTREDAVDSGWESGGHWLCATCFGDFRDRLGASVAVPP